MLRGKERKKEKGRRRYRKYLHHVIIEEFGFRRDGQMSLFVAVFPFNHRQET